MKSLIKLSSVFVILVFFGCSSNSNEDQSIIKEYHEKLLISVANHLNQIRKDALIQINIDALTKEHPDFNSAAFLVIDSGKEIPSQIEDVNGDGVADNIVFLIDFKSGETKELTVRFSKQGKKSRSYPKRTQAVLGEKVDYKLTKGEYTGGDFCDVDSAKVPANHFAHDALYRIEGPGWESDLVAYRFYLDSRNRNDIFGKKIKGLILDEVGVNDLASNSKESYTRMLDWGMDIFKVGESLGIGSIAMWYDNKVFPVSKTDSVITIISMNGPVKSDVYTKYYGWQVGEKRYDLSSNLSISAGSRLTKADLNISDGQVNFCTGLAKHDSCEFIKSQDTNSGWGYIGLYGKQSLSGDDLGIAVFYKTSDLVKNTEDNLSYILVLKPINNKLEYYFAAAWQQEPDGIIDKNQFKSYLNRTIEELDSPVEVSVK